MSVENTFPPARPLYARFSRRLRGIFIDWIVVLIAISGVLLVASTIAADSLSRALGIGVIAALLLYEPVLVSLTGGTIGHHLTNLRVVDDATGGTVGFLKACARLLIKSVLGWYSFVIIAATQRNQAIHDLVTRSTVQIRDPARARQGQFVTERVVPVAHMPAAWMRVLMICLYLLLAFVVIAALAAITTELIELISGGCRFASCLAAKKSIDLAFGIALLLAMAAVIALGWRGRLYGARAGRASR